MYKSSLLEVLSSDQDEIICCSLERYWENQATLAHHVQIIAKVSVLQDLLQRVEKSTASLASYIKERRAFNTEFWPIEEY